MNVKNIKSVSKVLALILGGLAGVFFIYVFVSITAYLFGVFSETFILNEVPAKAEEIIKSSPRLIELTKSLESYFITPMYSGILGYSSWKGSKLFEKLSDGNSPFNFDFSHIMKRISYLLIIADIIPSLAYTLLITFSKEFGFALYIKPSYLTLMGLMLYVFSQILNYGISLQQLSDETV